MDPTKQQSVRQEFDKHFNMSPAEMQTHFSSEASDMASLSPKISKRAGVTHGKKVLALKQKPDWADDDYTVAGTATYRSSSFSWDGRFGTPMQRAIPRS